ncbi:MAG: DUF3800 domain-containing protein [Candidatus Saccharibacteria bacterium]|nr:DUF3800 domain-containing protein [Candidatus Saccharibacteria bacterium]
MKIAIDESGDSGRKFWKGSSKWFILTAVVVPDDKICGPTCQAVDNYRKINGNGQELHFAHNSHEQHVEFLKYMHDQEFIFASVCINKRRLIAKKPYVFRNKISLLNFAFEKLFVELKPWLDHPVVVMDTSGSKYLNHVLSNHLLRLFGSAHKGDHRYIERVRAVDSRNEPLVQLADYVAGSVHHHINGKYKTRTFEEYLEDKGKLFFV